MKACTEFLVETGNPAAFDKTIQSFGAALVENGTPGDYVQQDGYYVMRVLFVDPGFVKFAIENQGYGKIIKEIL